MSGCRRAAALVLVVLSVLGVVAGCSSGSRDVVVRTTTAADDTITVGSFDFAESELLAEIYSQALESGGYRVRRAFNLGPREFVAPALTAGLVEFLPEYAGTALQFASLGANTPASDVAHTHDALVRALQPYELAALAAAPAQNANAFVVRRDTAQRYGLHDLSDVGDVAGELTLGGPPECPSRPLCLPGLEDTYGARFEEFVPLDAGGPLTLDALVSGTVDIALLFTSDPAIDRDDFVELVDDRGLQPAENVTPIVRTAVVALTGTMLVAVVDAVSIRLTTAGLRELNAQATSTSEVPVIAAQWLREQGLA